MSWYNYPVRIFYNLGSGLAIFLVKKKLKKNPSNLGKWILLAKLYEVKQQKREAIQSLKLAQKLFPKSDLLKMHLERLQKGRSAS